MLDITSLLSVSEIVERALLVDDSKVAKSMKTDTDMA